jgi:hypothetical protein
MDLFIPLPGGQVWAQDTGGAGPPVVLLHPGCRIPLCRTVTAPGADHLLPLRAPELLAELISAATTSRSARNAAPGA